MPRKKVQCVVQRPRRLHFSGFSVGCGLTPILKVTKDSTKQSNRGLPFAKACTPAILLNCKREII